MDKGLTTQEIAVRAKQYGRSIIKTEKSSTFLSLLASQFFTFINGILFLAGVFSIVVHDVVDGVFILSVIVINALFGFVQEYRAEKSLEKLQHFTSPVTRVIRDGKEHQIPALELVPGDLVVISEGERIPADGILTLDHHIEIDESILTGESLPVIKNLNDTVFLGTLVTKGRGRLLIQTIGMETRFGQIADTLSSIKTELTPLQKQLVVLGRILSLSAMLVALLLIPLGISQGKNIVDITLLAVSIGVAAIPEGLPAVITIALAIGTSRMAKQKAIIRKMASVETLGSMQYVLVDKTGTLTENKMRVKNVWIPDRRNEGFFIFGCILGNTASLIQHESLKGFDIVGDKTDGALLLYATERHKELLRVAQEGQVLDEFVFDTKTRMITTVWKKGAKIAVFSRGAPEAILKGSILSEKEKQNVFSPFLNCLH